MLVNNDAILTGIFNLQEEVSHGACDRLTTFLFLKNFVSFLKWKHTDHLSLNYVSHMQYVLPNEWMALANTHLSLPSSNRRRPNAQLFSSAGA
jgi:hypothetical protein